MNGDAPTGKEAIIRTAEIAAGAVSFDRILIIGLLLLLGLILIFSGLLSCNFFKGEREHITSSLELYKNIASTLVGGLIGALTGHTATAYRGASRGTDPPKGLPRS